MESIEHYLAKLDEPDPEWREAVTQLLRLLAVPPKANIPEPKLTLPSRHARRPKV